MGGCQNYGPFLGTLNNRCRIIIGTQKGTIILTTTHINQALIFELRYPDTTGRFDDYSSIAQAREFPRMRAYL